MIWLHGCAFCNVAPHVPAQPGDESEFCFGCGKHHTDCKGDWVPPVYTPESEATMSEADEIAATLPPPPPGATLEHARKIVRGFMPDESEVMIDNVAEAWAARAPRLP